MRRPHRIASALSLLLALTVSGPLFAQPVEVIEVAPFAAEHGTFGTYWYQGLAELDRYELEQSRYGELHAGEAVLIFVTEEFDEAVQVKWEHGARDHVVPIFKLNAYRRFYTGIYPYSLLTSVFVPVQGGNPNPLKLTFSAQEWCGHTYTQINRRSGAQYAIEARSYFQDEADQELVLPEVTSEDELFVRIRRAPETLPIGTFDTLPALHALRLLHLPFELQPATGTLEDVPSSPHSDAPARLYTLSYANFSRVLRVWFEPAFPHRILAWEEEQNALFNPGGGEAEPLTTRAVLTRSILVDYWTRNGRGDAVWREILGLTM
jgi:hypothetical protein